MIKSLPQRTVLLLLLLHEMAYNQGHVTPSSPEDLTAEVRYPERKEHVCLYENSSTDRDSFRYLACSRCYYEVFANVSGLPADSGQSTSGGEQLSLEAISSLDVGNATDEICVAEAGDEKCRRWLDCCRESMKCCDLQLADVSGGSPTRCPVVWDGHTCWDNTRPGEQVSRQCPEYLDACGPDGHLRKSCSAQGKWSETGVIRTKVKATQPLAKQCRYWEGYLDVDTYRLTTCAYCYKYLFRVGTELVPYGAYLVSVNGTVFPHMTFVRPDVDNRTSVRMICRTLQGEASCRQWLECCQAARQCCQAQLSEGDGSPTMAVDDERWCPSTWDGFACWRRVKAGRSEQASCPGYIPYAMPSADAVKTCTVNGTWYRSLNSNKEWTNYTSCLQFGEFRINIYVKLACNALSLATLVPALVIFLAYRSLRRQHRIRLHINLFSSFVLYAVINILWELLVVYDRLNNTTTETRMSKNTVGCKLLYLLARYSRSTNFLWMFCEGLYLHRLIAKAFQPPRKLLPFYIFGWGLPWIPIIAYSVIRIFIRNESCWVHHVGHYEWIVYTPNLVAMAANVVFLIDILRILLTQIQSHPNEPSNYRRALKATFVLVPLFGIQLFLVIYRPPLGSQSSVIYENVSAVIVNSQGFLVALVFCLLNGEVLGILKRTCSRYGYHVEGGESRKTNVTVTTQATDVYTRESPTYGHRTHENKNKYIAMKPMNGNNGYLT